MLTAPPSLMFYEEAQGGNTPFTRKTPPGRSSHVPGPGGFEEKERTSGAQTDVRGHFSSGFFILDDVLLLFNSSKWLKFIMILFSAPKLWKLIYFFCL